MEEKSESPSLPSNYVTLLQLQERWIKEQQRKQKEKEKEEEEKRELEKLKKEKGKEKIDSNPRSRAGYRNAKVITRRFVKVARPKAAEVEAVEEKEEEEKRKLAKLKEEKGKTDSNHRFRAGYRNAKVITRRIVEVARTEAAEVESVEEKEEEEKREPAKLKKEKWKEKTDSDPMFRAGYRNAKVITSRIMEVAHPEAAEMEAVEEKEEEEKRELAKLKKEKGKEKTDSDPRFRAGYRNAKVITSRIMEVAHPEAAEMEAVEEKEEEEKRELAKLKKEKGKEKTDSNPRFCAGYRNRRNAKVITSRIVEVARPEAEEVEAVEEKEKEEKRELIKLKEEKGKEKTDSNSKFLAGYRNAKVITRRIVEVARPEAAEVEAVEDKTGGGEVELKKKKRWEMKRNKNKKEGDMAGESENQAPEGRGEREDVPARSGGERKGGRSEMRRRSENSVVAADRTVEIERKLGSMSVKEGTVNGGSVRRNVMNRGEMRFELLANSGGQRRFGRRENWGKMVWVRKGEDSDGNGGGILSSLD